jgi:hypothetical protein
MMEQISSIHVVPLALTAVQVIPKVVVLRYRMDKIVDHKKWIENLVCVHSCCSVCNTNEVDGNVMYYYLYIMLQKYQFEHRDYSYISCHKGVGILLAKK